MEGYSRNWSSLLPEIVDRLAKRLKESRRWKRDGPALRQLNRHWCLQLSQHLVDVKPHECRSIVEEDLQSLLKFKQVTSLDVVAFGRSNGLANPWGSSAGAVKALSQLPKLSHLCIEGPFLETMDETDLRQLQGITSVYVTKGSVSRGELLKLYCLPLEKLRLDGWVYDLTGYLAGMPCLRQLDVEHLPTEADIIALNTLDEVTLNFRGPPNPLISEITSIVSLDIFCYGEDTVEPLVSLPKLRHLKLEVNSTSVLDSKSFRNLLRGLTLLELENNIANAVIDLPVDFGSEASRLTTLSLTRFDLSKSTHLEQSWRNLTQLTLWHCKGFELLMSVVPNRVSTALAVDASDWKKHAPFCNGSFNKIPKYSHKLTTLEIWFSKQDPLDCIDLASFCCLPELDTLKLHDGITWKDESCLCEGFERLLNLHNLSELFISGDPRSFTLLHKILRMPALTGLEKLTIDARLHGSDRIRLDASAEALRQKAPRLILDI